MRLILISLLIITGCATNPYKVCDEEVTDFHRNQCVSNVQQQQRRMAEYYFKNQQAFQMPNQQIQFQPVQVPRSTTTQTHCTNLGGGQINCTSY